MKKTLTLNLFLLIVILLAGCESIRLAPDEIQKQNTYIHGRTTELTAELAKIENTSDELQRLSKLGAKQSKAFLAYYGLPNTIPKIDSYESLLSDESSVVTEQAIINASKRADPFEIANSTLDLCIGIASLFGGALGVKIITALGAARKNSDALREIVQANELFKQDNPQISSSFKTAQSNQSSETKQIVTKIKSQM